MLGAPGLTGCSEQAPGEPGTEEGDPVSLRFSLYRAEADEASTRADAATDMADGKTFCIYAFPAGASTTTTEPLDHKVYTVKGGVATGELYLYRGTYDLYLVSYNSSTEVPELKNGRYDSGVERKRLYVHQPERDRGATQPNGRKHDGRSAAGSL